MNTSLNRLAWAFLAFAIILVLVTPAHAAGLTAADNAAMNSATPRAEPSEESEDKALILQDMSWFDVQEYLKTSDMVLIPIGSTEQHGPHLPLGTDSIIAQEICKRVSARTGVLVAPVVFSGYSVYHSGFPGTLSLEPKTMEEVLFETAEMLIKYGFRRFLFFNAHGGNGIVQANVLHRINKTTEAVAVSVGVDSPIQQGFEEGSDFFDQHAGVSETSIMLYLTPDRVRMDRAEKPTIDFGPRRQALLAAGRSNPVAMSIFWSLLAAPEETKKGGASHEISSNGIWSMSDPNEATKEQGERTVRTFVANTVKYIESWRSIEK